MAVTEFPPELDVRRIMPRERHAIIFGLLERLREGQSFLLLNDHDPRPLRMQLEMRYPGRFSWEYRQEGPEVWRVEIGRPAQGGHDCTCGG